MHTAATNNFLFYKTKSKTNKKKTKNKYLGKKMRYAFIIFNPDFYRLKIVDCTPQNNFSIFFFLSKKAKYNVTKSLSRMRNVAEKRHFFYFAGLVFFSCTGAQYTEVGFIFVSHRNFKSYSFMLPLFYYLYSCATLQQSVSTESKTQISKWALTVK